MLTIIAEGCDGAGKTTLIMKLMSAYRTVHYFHATKDTTEVQYLEALDTNADVLIMDRFWLSEDIYGPIVRGAEPMDAEVKERLDAALEARGPALLLFVNADYEVVKERFINRSDDYITIDQLAEIYNAYQEALHGKAFYTSRTPIVEVRTDLSDAALSAPVLPDTP